jgi:hypothetical protein
LSIANLQRRDTEVGRIRLGTRTNGKQHSIDTFRFTSGAQHLIEEIAALYGGEVKPWVNDKKHLFEVITTVNIIPIYLPPQKIDPWYESWGKGVCLRRCDGIRDMIHDKPCDCAFDESGKPNRCKPTTRVNVMLADVQGLGVWRLETHGIYAAGEMVQLSDRIQGIRMPLPARLYLEPRDGKKFDRSKGKVETLDYNVPVILIDSVTSRHVQLGHDAISQALAAGGHGPTSAPPAIEAPKAPALPAAPAGPDPQMVERALAMIATATPDQMDDVHARIVKTGSPQVLLDAFQVRLGEHRIAAQQRPPLVLDGGEPDDGPGWGATSDDEFPPDDDERRDEQRQEYAANQAPQAAPVAPPAAQEPPARTEAPPAATKAPEASGDKVAVMTRLLSLGAEKGYKRAQLDEQMQTHFGVSLKTATAEQLDALAKIVG